MVGQEALHRSSLVLRHLEEVAEATSAEDDLLARALGVVYCRARVYLRRADGGHERARHREVGIELRPVVHRVAC